MDGVELSLTLEEDKDEQASSRERKGRRMRSPVTTRSPQHRKVHRRLQSPPPYDPGGLSDSEEVRIPTTEELAQSFLSDEPVQELRELEANIAANSEGLEESIISESSDGDDLGTGATIGLPRFLAGFLQGIVDRLKVRVKNVEARLETKVSGDGQQTVPVTLKLHVGEAEFASLGTEDDGTDATHGKRQSRKHLELRDMSLSLLSDAAAFSELSNLLSRSSPADSKHQPRSPPPAESTTSRHDFSPTMRSTTASATRSIGSAGSQSKSHVSPKSPEVMRASALTADSDRFADAGEEDVPPTLQSQPSDFGIQPGDDNISWGSRRSRSSAPAEDLWNSMASEDDLPDSLLLERASTPRATSSRGTSPEATRTRRNMSPYAKSLQSPGSWPRPDERAQRHRSQKSPGSWPILEQSQQSVFQPLTPGPPDSHESVTDNKRNALEASFVEPQDPETLPEPDAAAVEDMAASRVFSHEEAESMYMSAMTHGSRMHIPGGWGSEAMSNDGTDSPEAPKRPSAPSDAGLADSPLLDDGLTYVERPYSTSMAPLSGNATPRASSPEPTKDNQKGTDMMALKTSRQLLHVDTLFIWLPNAHDPSEQPQSAAAAQTQASASLVHYDMPGTFSAYSEMAASRRKPTGLTREGSGSAVWEPPQNATRDSNASQSIDIDVGVVRCQVDISCCRLLYRLGMQAVDVLKPVDEVDSGKQNQPRPKHVNDFAISLVVQDFRLAFKESVDAGLGAAESDFSLIDNLLTLCLQEIRLSSKPGELDLRTGSFSVILGTSHLLSFDRDRNMKSSVVVSEATPDIALIIVSTKPTMRRPVTEVSVETLPMDLLLDLQVIDETLSPFGGLNGVLEAGNSVLSESGVTSSPISSKPSKGVRFEGDPQYIGTEPELKINGRVGGVYATLQGHACSARLRTTTIKAVYREQGAVATLEQVLLTGPHQSEGASSPMLADLSTLRLDYLLSPQDKDLERLLSLLTPSKDKYDSDDDILLDTLLRQRRKGAVARVSITDIRFKFDSWESLAPLSGLGIELGKLSAVAKYLPEDERPGLLTLIRVKEFDARLPLNERFGKFHLGISDFHCAHVGLPALLALSVGNVKVSQAGHVELVHPLTHLVGSDNLPMVMARMLGDEVEPTVKVKLFNVCLEYSVPIILALIGLDEQSDAEEVVAELAKSAAGLAFAHEPPTMVTKAASDASESVKKRINVDLLVHDSALGLNPQNLPSKGLLVLTDARFSSLVPPEDTLTVVLELRKAGLFVADQIRHDDTDQNSSTRSSQNNPTIKPKLTLALLKQGFVSVGSIMTAKMSVRVEESADNRAKSIDVDVRNELLLLETCADSTQTLIAVLNGLTPPTPPSKQPKYLTEPMTIEDMMASFTGNAYAKPEKASETLFDLEEEREDNPDMMLDMPTFGEDDDGLFAESEMTSSLYGPISGVLGGVDKPEDDDGDDDYPETAESLLEDDPFEMPTSPTDAPLSDSSLITELNSQAKSPISDEPANLGLYEIDDLGFDALGGSQRALGTQHRFNTPASGRRKVPTTSKQIRLPFKLRLRDLHVIWNIYDGYDWQRTRDGITEAVEQVETRAEERKARRRQSHNEREDDESVIGDILFNSIYIGVPSNHDAQELRRQINKNIDDLASETESVPMSGMSRPTTAYSASGRPLRQRQRRRLKLERSKTHKIAFELKGISADVLVFSPDSADIVSSVDVKVNDFEIFDNVPTSTWRKFLTHLNNDPSAREMSKPMMHVELLNVRTLENFAASEIVLHVSVLPLRLHVDQDALDFITRFFEFKDESVNSSGSVSEQPFLQRVEIDTVDMCLDYKPKKVDYVGLRSGHTTEFMNFIILDAANIRLKRAIIYGIKGFEPLHKTLNDVWMPDVKRNQLPTILAGLAPVRSLVNIGAGVRDVVAIPVREYRKDGRIVRSIQKGAFHFGKTTASELAHLGAKVAIGTQNLLQGAEGLLSPASALPYGRPSAGGRLSSEQGWHDVGSEDEEHEQRAISAYANQPLGVMSGLRSARRYLEHDLLTARDALIAVQGEVLESSSPGSAAVAVARHAPTVILRPVIGASRAVGTALLGVGNQIDRSNVRRVEDVSAARTTNCRMNGANLICQKYKKR